MEEPYLFDLVERNQTGFIDYLLTKKIVNVDTRDAEGNTPLFFTNSYDMLVLLIKHGADVNIRNNKGETPLHFAVKSYGSLDIRCLLDAGAKVKGIKDSDGNSILMNAAKYCTNNGVFRILIEHHENESERSERTGIK